jgi:hypothetical protein
MSEALEVAREQEVSWRAALGAPGEPTLLSCWCIAPQVFAFMLCRCVEEGWPLLHAHSLVYATAYSSFALAVWAIAYVWEVVARRRRLIAKREAERLQRAAPDPRPRVDMVAVVWTVWLAAMAMLGMFYPLAAGISALCALACLCVTILLDWAIERRRAVREHRALWTALAARLEREGAHRLEEGDPLRVVVARRFWREQQERATATLQRRFEPAPAHPPREPDYLLCALVIALVMVTLGPSGIVILLLMPVLMPFAAVVVWFVEDTLSTQRRRAERRFSRLEQRRIATMAELAGGLTLAEYVADDALVGALSPDGAQGGDLERVEDA